jgi:hypothetical protein
MLHFAYLTKIQQYNKINANEVNSKEDEVKK